MKWKCFKTRQQIILDRIRELDERLNWVINKLRYYFSFKPEMQWYYEDVIEEYTIERDALQRCINRMYNLYSKKYDTP